jgi:hypothetical protein
MFLFLVALVFFGLIVDVAEAIKLGPTIIFGLRFFEDAGELVIHSLILWYVLSWPSRWKERFIFV